MDSTSSTYKPIWYTQNTLKRLNRYLLSSLLFPLIACLVYLGVAIFIAIQAENTSKIKSDVILVLGARSYIDGKYNPCLEARVRHAVELYKSNYAPKLLVSGGNDSEDNSNEAETMKKIAIENGVKSDDILLEKAATSTYENLSLSEGIMKKNKLKSIILVTEPFHIARALLVAHKLNYNVTASPAQESPCWQPNKYATKYFLKEPIAISIYKLQNKL